MARGTPKQQLADALLPEPLDEWVHKQRARGRSWRQIERELYEATDNRVDVTAQTLRNWYPHERAAS